MSMQHATKHDICILGPTSSGKSYLARIFAQRWGYLGSNSENRVSVVYLVKDMSPRDFLQLRNIRKTAGKNSETSTSVETTWTDSPIIKAAINGHLLILDGIENLGRNSTLLLSALGRLIQDRELMLPDGRLLCCKEKAGKVVRGGDDNRVWIHPSFRM